MKAVTLQYVIPRLEGIWEEHRCGKNAGYECPTIDSTFDVQSDWPLVKVWGKQGTFWVPMKNLISLSFREKLEECPVCSISPGDPGP